MRSANTSVQSLLLHAREAGHVGVREDVGRVLVVLRVRHRQADFRHARRPVEHQAIRFLVFFFLIQ
jgi:hypothetical protein